MKKVFQSNTDNRIRNYLSTIACDMYGGHLRKKENWVLVDEFAYGCQDEGEEMHLLCGWVYRTPIVLNNKSYSLVMSNYIDTPEEHAEILESFKKWKFDEIYDIEDNVSIYPTEWVLDKKRLHLLSGGNV